MDILKSAFYFLAVLSILIIVHEWGHFIVAKLCKMRVEDFSLFFGKRLIRLGERNGTEYNIRAIPLGGFVKIAGMEPDDISNGAPIFKHPNTASKRLKLLRGLDEEAFADINLDNVSERIRKVVEDSVSDDAHLLPEGRAELRTLLNSTAINSDEHRYIEIILGAEMSEPDPHGYNQKPLWQRAAVIFAGPFMSLFFGYILFCVMGFTTGLPDPAHLDNAIDVVIKDGAADRAGLKPGDRIIEINGETINNWESMIKPIHDNPNHPIQLAVLRNGERVDYSITPKAEQFEVVENGKTVKKTEGRLGFWPAMAWRRYTPAEAFSKGSEIVYFEVTMTLKTLFSKHAKENVGGPIAIAGQIHQDTKEGPRRVMLTGAMLSVSLGLINLFPIPILDGGHLLLLGIEGLRRRKLSSREVGAAQMVGLAIIGVLFVLVMYNDIARLFFSNSK